MVPSCQCTANACLAHLYGATAMHIGADDTELEANILA